MRMHVPLSGVNLSAAEGTTDDQAVSLAFGRGRVHPFELGTYCQDLSIARWGKDHEIDTVRLTVKAAPRAAHGSSGSGLTDMIRSKSGSGNNGGGVVLSQAVKARWRLPEVDDDLSVVEERKAGGKGRTTIS